MDLGTFCATIIGHIAWPATAILLVYLFRKSIDRLLTRMKSAKAGGAEAEFEDGLEKLERKADEADLPPAPPSTPPSSATTPPPSDPLNLLLEHAPAGAIQYAWKQVEE